MTIYKYHIFFCTNKRPGGHILGCCATKGSLELRNYMKVRLKELNIPNVKINASSCLDKCKNGAAVVVYPDNIWYKINNKNDIEKIIFEHIINNKIVSKLQMEL